MLGEPYDDILDGKAPKIILNIQSEPECAVPLVVMLWGREVARVNRDSTVTIDDALTLEEAKQVIEALMIEDVRRSQEQPR